VNSSGQVVGWAMNTVSDPLSMAYWSTLYNPYAPITPYQMRAFLWQYGVMRDLGTLGTGTNAFAMAINEQGQVIGISYIDSTPNQMATNCSFGAPLPTQDPFFWENGNMTDLGNLGGTCSFPSWINNLGQVVGNSNLAADQIGHAFLWTKARGMQDLGTLGGTHAQASFISDSGVIVGGSTLEGDAQYDAYFWDGKMHDLGTLDGANCAYAFSVNTQGQVVGNSGTNCQTAAFLWDNGGPIVDLSTLIINPSSAFGFLGVISINDRGEIAGMAGDTSDLSHAVVLIPCDSNHPNIEGCDYGLVDPPTAAEVRPAEITKAPAAAASQVKLSPVEMMARFRSAQAGGNRRVGTPQTSPQ
jgi:probable HAF family extracellular repeat protein